ncbi:MAG: hypothetical protein J6M39_03045 [Lachnospiraceae bacterium]|nr:hypothetical protein [Lachnospiraceae bacterium]
MLYRLKNNKFIRINKLDEKPNCNVCENRYNKVKKNMKNYEKFIANIKRSVLRKDFFFVSETFKHHNWKSEKSNYNDLYIACNRSLDYSEKMLGFFVKQILIKDKNKWILVKPKNKSNLYTRVQEQ